MNYRFSMPWFSQGLNFDTISNTFTKYILFFLYSVNRTLENIYIRILYSNMNRIYCFPLWAVEQGSKNTGLFFKRQGYFNKDGCTT